MFYFAADFSGRDFSSEVARALLFLLNIVQFYDIIFNIEN